MKKILFFIPNLNVGGSERMISEMANYFSINNKVTLATWSNKSEKDYFYLDSKIKRSYLNIDRENNGIFSKIYYSLVRIKKIRKVIIDNSPDVVVSFTEASNIFSIISSIGLRKKIIISERNNPENIPLTANEGSSFEVNYKWHFLRKIFYRFAFIVVVQTKEAEKWIRKNFNCKKTLVIVNSIRDLPEPKKHRNKSILAVGRFTLQKGFDKLIKAFALCHEDINGWDLKIVGDGEEMENLRKLVTKLNINNKVNFIGYHKNPEDYMETSSIFVLSSRCEGFPNVLLEAMSMGMPVISTDCKSGPKEIINNEKNGLIVKVDDELELSKAIKRLVNDEKLRMALSEEAVNVRKDYELNKIMQKWECII